MKNDWTLKDGRIVSLITPKEYESLPNGTKLISIFGKEKIKTEKSDKIDDPNYIDQDTRYGYIAFGTLREQAE